MTDVVKSDVQSEVYGKMAAISGVGITLGPLVGGHILEDYPTYGFSMACTLSSALFVLNSGSNQLYKILKLKLIYAPYNLFIFQFQSLYTLLKTKTLLAKNQMQLKKLVSRPLWLITGLNRSKN